MASTNESANGHTKIQYRVIYCEPGKPVEDRSSDTHINFPIDDESELARDILRECESRLLLLKVAIEDKQSIDTSLVRTVLDDVLLEIRDGGVIPGHLEKLAMLFKHSEILPPLRTMNGNPKPEIAPKGRRAAKSITERSLVS